MTDRIDRLEKLTLGLVALFEERNLDDIPSRYSFRDLREEYEQPEDDRDETIVDLRCRVADLESDNQRLVRDALNAREDAKNYQESNAELIKSTGAARIAELEAEIRALKALVRGQK